MNILMTTGMSMPMNILMNILIIMSMPGSTCTDTVTRTRMIRRR